MINREVNKMTISLKDYNGQIWPYYTSSESGKHACILNLAQPYAGMGIDLELKTAEGLFPAGSSSETFDIMTASPFPSIKIENEPIRLVYAFSGKITDTPSPLKSLGAGVSLAQDATTYADFTEEVITWYGGTIFTPGYVARIVTQDKESQEWSPQWIREGVVVSRKIVTADRTPYLEVIIQPTHQGWAHKVMSNLGTGTSTNALISPAAGPVPFVFTTYVSKENVTKTGTLNIQIHFQYIPPASPSILKNVSSSSSFYDGEMRTEIIQYEGIPITKGEEIHLIFNSMFPLKSTVKLTPMIAGHPGRLITLGDYIKNYDPSQAPAALGTMSSPSMSLPGGNCTYYLTSKFIIRQDSTDTEITPGEKYIQYEEIVTL